ncbi:hypothetical protein O988_00540 [Pseudogymnoascus sp. VKM F-3808]|nr:hypothetical protein O988_00540 [Pseudogymnoascus sp. VKM F-3808]
MNIADSIALTQCAQCIGDCNVSLPYLPACLTLLYPTCPKLDAAFKPCYQGNHVAAFSSDDTIVHGDAYPCFQYSEATSNAQEMEIMNCTVGCHISGMGAPTLSGSGRAVDVSVSEVLAMGLVLVGLLLGQIRDWIPRTGP